MRVFPGYLRPLVIAAAAVALAAVAFVVVGRLAPAVEHGALISWLGDYQVDRVRLLGLEWYVDVSGGKKDDLTAAFLASTALAAFAAARLRWTHDPAGDATTFAMVGGLAAFLAIDEALAVHETIGHNLPVLRRLPGVDHADDAIVLLYGLVCLTLAPRLLRVVLAAPRARVILTAAVALALLAALHDVGPLHSETREELLEMATAGLGFLGFLALTVERALAPGAPAPAPSAPRRRPS